MDHEHLFHQLARHRAVFHDLLEKVGDAEVRWKPAPDKWCLLEVACHLLDEEREDFRARVQHVLMTPEAPLPQIDPPGWVTARRYMDQDFATVLERFLAERDKSVDWLWSLDAPPWRNAHPHPRFGPMSAELFLVNWVAHDHHHIRQINNLRYGYLHSTSPEPLDYAGPW
jgi:hypothetical protein